MYVYMYFVCVCVCMNVLCVCMHTCMYVCTRWRTWLRHYATSRKVAGSVTDGVNGIFYCFNLSGPGVDQSSNRNEYQIYFQGVKAAGAED